MNKRDKLQRSGTDVGLIQTWFERLPLHSAAEFVSLNEGNTPLIRLKNLPSAYALDLDVYVKYEGANPTGSFKDRGMTVAVSQALIEGKQAIICASTGNTSASAAAYAARAGMRAFVLIPEGKIALGKLAQAIIQGATIVQILGNFDQGMTLVKELVADLPLALVNSVNPYRLQGQKTAAFEIVQCLGKAPDYHCLPVGNAGNISAYWMGYAEAAGQDSECIELARAELNGNIKIGAAMTKGTPRMLGYQASGAAPILRGEPVPNPETIATAIRIGNPQSWKKAVIAARESGGWFNEVTDEEILQMQKALASQEGIFCEPASAASLAGLVKDAQAGRIESAASVVCTLTGSGLKDTAIALDGAEDKMVQVKPELAQVRDLISKSFVK